MCRKHCHKLPTNQQTRDLSKNSTAMTKNDVLGAILLFIFIVLVVVIGGVV